MAFSLVLEARLSVLSAAIFGEPESGQQRTSDLSSEEQQVMEIELY